MSILFKLGIFFIAIGAVKVAAALILRNRREHNGGEA